MICVGEAKGDVAGVVKLMEGAVPSGMKLTVRVSVAVRPQHSMPVRQRGDPAILR